MRKTFSLVLVLIMIFSSIQIVFGENEFDIQNGVLVKYNGNGGDIVIPNSVTEIDFMVFYMNKELVSVQLPNSLEKIGGWAFRNCKSLTSITIPGSVKEMDGHIFAECHNLTAVEIQEGVPYIPQFAFWGSNLETVIVPRSVTEIGLNGIMGNDNLTIKGYSGSFAEAYARENRINFIDIEAELTNIATPTSSTVLVNGANTVFDAYNINDNNYFKLRDFAYVVNGTQKQFEVTWDGENNAINLISDKPYTQVGGEMANGDGIAKIPVRSTSAIYKNGIQVILTAYMIDGNNYFKLRDVAELFEIEVTWDESTQTIGIDSNRIAEQDKIAVSTAEEFVNAIGSNRIINVKAGTYDFTSFNRAGTYDAIGLIITEVRNLSIIGAIDGVTEFVNEDRFAEILTFDYCENISVSNIKASHTPQPYQCDGGVLYLRNSSNINVLNCYFDGCGSVGISTWKCNDLNVKDTVITNCSLRGVNISWADNVVFDNVEITKHRAYANAVSVDNSSNVAFNNCEISDNKSIEWALIEVRSSDVRIDNSIIANNSNEFAEDAFSDLSLFKATAGATITVSNTVISKNRFAYETVVTERVFLGDVNGEVNYENCTFEDNVFDPTIIPERDLRG